MPQRFPVIALLCPQLFHFSNPWSGLNAPSFVAAGATFSPSVPCPIAAPSPLPHPCRPPTPIDAPQLPRRCCPIHAATGATCSSWLGRRRWGARCARRSAWAAHTQSSSSFEGAGSNYEAQHVCGQLAGLRVSLCSDGMCRDCAGRVCFSSRPSSAQHSWKASLLASVALWYQPPASFAFTPCMLLAGKGVRWVGQDWRRQQPNGVPNGKARPWTNWRRSGLLQYPGSSPLVPLAHRVLPYHCLSLGPPAHTDACSLAKATSEHSSGAHLPALFATPRALLGGVHGFELSAARCKRYPAACARSANLRARSAPCATQLRCGAPTTAPDQ